jgi:N6-L-threonylcarbamoyladenine synthase
LYVLGIETSCDETGCSIVDEKREIKANVLFSQVKLHTKYGGIVPEIASRAHLEVINPLLEEVLAKANLEIEQIDGIAITQGPGLVGSLLVGLTTAKTLSYLYQKPLLGINHLEAHLLSIFLASSDEEIFPFIGLLVSGGHTMLVLVQKEGDYKVLAETIDDAAGEAYDKVAKLLGLGYPGGPVIEKISRQGNEETISFPEPKFKNKKMAFSFSGLKTAVANYVKRCKEKKGRWSREDVAASFQKAIVEVLAKNTLQAARENKVNKIILCGGVACNQKLQKIMKEKAEPYGIKVLVPPPTLCTDNGAMVAYVGVLKLKANQVSSLKINAQPDWELNDGILKKG